MFYIPFIDFLKRLMGGEGRQKEKEKLINNKKKTNQEH
jgi:hypothetical protein